MGAPNGSSLLRLRDRLGNSLVTVPGLIVLGAAALAAATIRLDSATKGGLLERIYPIGSGESTTALLGAIAGATITLTALVFSITMLVLQLSSTQFSPRVLRTFLRDRTAQTTLGVLAGTFVYALLVLRAFEVNNDGTAPLSAAVAGLFALASLAVFVNFIDHIAHKIRAVSILTSIAHDTKGTMDRTHPEHPDVNAGREPALTSSPRHTVAASDDGYVLSVRAKGLVAIAEELDSVIEVLPEVGSFVATGSPIALVHGDRDVPVEEIRSHFLFGTERTMRQDLAFGFRQLVDVVERAMSPSLNDTTTAVQAVDQLHEVLQRLAQRPFPPTQHRDAAGRVRLVVPVAPWESYVALAADEVLEVSRGSRRVRLAVERMLHQCLDVARPEHRAALAERIERLEGEREGERRVA